MWLNGLCLVLAPHHVFCHYPPLCSAMRQSTAARRFSFEQRCMLECCTSSDTPAGVDASICVIKYHASRVPILLLISSYKSCRDTEGTAGRSDQSCNRPPRALPTSTSRSVFTCVLYCYCDVRVWVVWCRPDSCLC